MSTAEPSAPKGDTVAIGDRDPIDRGALTRWLVARGVVADGVDVDVVRFAAGHSNLTYRVDAGGRSFVLRAPPPGAATVGGTGHDMLREQRVMARVGAAYKKVPAIVAVEEDASASPLGVPFYLMAHVAGRVLRHRAPKDLDLSAPRMRAITGAVVDELAAVHAVDVDAAGLADLGRAEGYVARQVEGWIGRYERARTDEVSDLEAAIPWLRAHTPSTTSGPPTLVHNDFKLDNVVLADDLSAIRAVLDWELCTVGEPLTDLGTTLAYWVEADDGDAVRALPLGLTHLPGSLTRLEVVERWQERTGRTAQNMVFYYVLSSFKVATIAQQIYARYVKGFTADPRFAALGFAAALVGQRIATVVERDSV
jgi:aminoglycoside phosphotransferase (APT) family kinase protein